jgi:hypothetical protein
MSSNLAKLVNDTQQETMNLLKSIENHLKKLHQLNKLQKLQHQSQLQQSPLQQSPLQQSPLQQPPQLQQSPLQQPAINANANANENINTNTNISASSSSNSINITVVPTLQDVMDGIAQKTIPQILELENQYHLPKSLFYPQKRNGQYRATFHKKGDIIKNISLHTGISIDHIIDHKTFKPRVYSKRSIQVQVN